MTIREASEVWADAQEELDAAIEGVMKAVLKP